VTYFHEEQRFRQPWLLALLMAVAVPAAIVASQIGPRHPKELEAAIVRAKTESPTT
jgi:hypothetical protein